MEVHCEGAEREDFLADRSLWQITQLYEQNGSTDLALCLESNQYILFFDMWRLLLINFRRLQWEKIYLDFIPVGLKLINFVATDGGLICLITEDGDFVVCNPLTKQFTMIDRPSDESYQNCAPTSLIHQLCFVTETVPGVALAGARYLCHFTLVLNVRRTLVFTSRGLKCWRPMDDRSFVGSSMSHVVQVVRQIMSSKIPRPKAEPTILYARSDAGPTRPSKFSLPLETAIAAIWKSWEYSVPVDEVELFLVVHSVPGEDHVVYIAVLREGPRPKTPQWAFRVWKHSLLDGSDARSEWILLKPTMATLSTLPLMLNFKPFKPTFKFCSC